MKSLFNRPLKYFLPGKIFIAVAVISFFYACSKKAETVIPVDCSTPKSFATDVKPIVQSSCSMDSDCHGSGSTSGPGPLLTYSQISNESAAVRSAVESGAMPKGGSLTASEKNTVLCWINNGAANN